MLHDFRRIALCIGLALGCVGVAQALDPVPGSNPFAVIVGVGEFTDPTIPARPTAVADATALHDVLADPKYLGIPDDRLILLTSKDDTATKENIITALNKAVTQTKAGDTVILGFFGRGSSVGEKTAFLTETTPFAKRADTAVMGSAIEKDLRALDDRKVMLLMDVDFTGFKDDKDKAIPTPALSDYTDALFNRSDSDSELPTKDKVFYLATSPLNAPLTQDGHGLFAKLLLDGLKGAADQGIYHEGYEPDGTVTIDEISKYLETEAPKLARTIGTNTLEKESVPVLLGDELSHFIVTKDPAVWPTVERQVKTLNELKLTDALQQEGTELLTKMPKLKALQELRRDYQALANKKVDVATFTQERQDLLDSLKLPITDVERYVTTVMQAIKLAETRYVKERTAGEWAAYAITGLFYKLDEELPADVVDDLKNPKGLTSNRIEQILREIRQQLGKREDLDGTKDVDTTISWMFVKNKDPYTVYFDEEAIKKIASRLTGEFRGVGIQIRQDLIRDGLLVVSPIKDSPAYKAGIKAGDLIIGIKREVGPEGEPLKADEPKEISTKGMKTDDAISLILGKVGVPVTLVVQREGEKEPMEFTIRRGLVSVETVLGIVRDKNDNWEFYIDEKNKIGYICLTQFTPTSFRDLYTAVTKLKKTGLNGLILDLRFNPGGLLTQAILICDMFIQDGLIVSVKYRTEADSKYFDRGAAAFLDFPMAVLINGSSASAAEIVSACLQDYNRAVVIGERSYGKGSVQNIENFPATNGQIKITTARYFPPMGKNIDKLSTKGTDAEEWGVKPDPGFEVKLGDEEQRDLAEYFRDREVIGKKIDPDSETKSPFKDQQLERALEYLRGQMKATRGDG